MDTQQKYILQDATIEDQELFKNGLNELLDKNSLALSLTINKRPITVKLEDGNSVVTFTDEPSIIIQKKVIVPEVEKDVKSPLSDEFNKNEPNKEA